MLVYCFSATTKAVYRYITHKAKGFSIIILMKEHNLITPRIFVQILNSALCLNSIRTGIGNREMEGFSRKQS